jgi:Cu2+-containing amine oxidase
MATRRAQEFVVWGLIDGGNYDNIVEYAFRDDGGMTFRMGNTGYNWPANPIEAHTHNALWRIDIDLNGAPHNSAYWLRHVEPYSLQAQDFKVAFNVEGARQWNAAQFTSLLIEDSATNVFGNRLGYEFTAVQTGTSRHYGYKEAWTRNDVYVTVYRDAELVWADSNSPWFYPDDYLLTHLNGESVVNKDLVVWIKTSAHHHPTDEDRSVNDLASGGTTGVTLTHWSGVNIEPHNLFNTNPLGGPVRCGS